MNPDLSVVIPAFNEEERIGRTLELIGDYLNRRGFRAEVIVVSDGSRDQTAAVVESRREKVPGLILVELERNRGKGQSVEIQAGQAMVLDPSAPKGDQGFAVQSEQIGFDATIKIPERFTDYAPVSQADPAEVKRIGELLAAELAGG